MFASHANVYCRHLFMLIFPVVLVIPSITAQKVPSTARIEEYDDAMLDEIFAETNAKFPDGAIVAGGPSLPLPLPTATVSATKDSGRRPSIPAPAPSPKNDVAAALDITANGGDGIDPNRRPAPGAIYTNPGFEPNQAPIGFDRPPSNGFSNAGRDNAMLFQGPLTDLVGQGAQNFYNGVRAAGRILGIDAGQYRPYEIPLLSQGARFFGRRK